MARCTACNAILRRDDTYRGSTDAPTHEACDPDASGKVKAWDFDNGETEDAAATAAGDA